MKYDGNLESWGQRFVNGSGFGFGSGSGIGFSAGVCLRPEGVQVGVAVISTGRGLQEDLSKHGQVDGDDLLRVVIALSERCSDLLLVHQTWQSNLEKRNVFRQSRRKQLYLHSLDWTYLRKDKWLFNLSNYSAVFTLFGKHFHPEFFSSLFAYNLWRVMRKSDGNSYTFVYNRQLEFLRFLI